MGRGTAIHYGPRGYDDRSKRMVGLAAANAGFLRAYLDHAMPGPFHCRAADEGIFSQFMATFQTTRDCIHIPPHRARMLAEIGTLHVPGPALALFVGRRLQIDPRSYSLTGVTHAMASPRALGAVRDLLAAPIFEWDALVCASTSIRNLVIRIAETHADYLEERIVARPQLTIQLPKIPLGVDVSRLAEFTPEPEFRRSLGAPEEAFIVLYLGRLSHHTKAHPFPF